MIKILITGGSGQIGRALQQLKWLPDISIVAPSSIEMNLADLDSTKNYLAKTTDFSAIINCAAYTSVDRAEREPNLAFNLNAIAVKNLAHFAEEHNLPIVHVSTDYVFDGGKTAPYVENDQTAPLGVYGQSKLAGEQELLKSGARSLILRTAWVVSVHGENFVKTMLRLGSQRDTLNVVADQRGCPTSAMDIAKVLQSVTLRLMADQRAPTGIYHFVNAGVASWYELAQFIFERSNSAGYQVPVVNSISTEQYPTPASRPQNSALDTSRIIHDFDIKPRFWKLAVSEIIDELLLRED